MKRPVAAILLSAVSGVIWLYLWWGRFQYHHVLLLAASYTAILALVLAGHVYFHDNRQRLGLRFDNFRRAARWYGTLTLVGAGSILLAGRLWGNFRLDHWSDIYVYLLWSALQQYGLQNFLRLRSEDLLRRKSGAGSRDRPNPGITVVSEDDDSMPQMLSAILLSSALFALYHLPNLRLALFSFAGALVWCFSYARIPSLFWAWISQAVITTTLLLFFKYSLLGQFQIGYPGQRYQSYGSGVQVSAGYDARGKALIVTLPAPDQGVRAQVRVFDASGQRQSEWTAYENFGFSGNAAVGDLGFGPGDEVAVTPGPGASNPAVVRIFDATGRLLKEFSAAEVTGGYGAWISIQCGKILLCPGPGPYSRAEVFEFSSSGELENRWKFPSLELRNGLRAAALCRAGSGPASEKRMKLLLWGTTIPTNPSTLFQFDPVARSLSSWTTFSTTYGLNAVPVHLGSGRMGVAVAPGAMQGYPAQIQVYDAQGQKLRDFLAYSDRLSCGSHIAAVDISGDGQDELVLGEGTGPARPSTVRIIQLDGKLLRQWDAY